MMNFTVESTDPLIGPDEFLKFRPLPPLETYMCKYFYMKAKANSRVQCQFFTFVLCTTRGTRPPVNCRRTLKNRIVLSSVCTLYDVFSVEAETRGRRRMRRTTNCDKLKIFRSSRRSLRGNITIHLEEMN
jgi:hypothetical protein